MLSEQVRCWADAELRGIRVAFGTFEGTSSTSQAAAGTALPAALSAEASDATVLSTLNTYFTVDDLDSQLGAETCLRV